MESNIKSLQTARASPPGHELSRLIAAAVVNKTFCHALLTNPAHALNKGFCNERFNLTSAESALVMAIRATNLVDFAQQVAEGKAWPNSHATSNRYFEPRSEAIDVQYTVNRQSRISKTTKLRSGSHRKNLKKRPAA